jgi:MYXO-CTERM domain-containing protein
VKETTYKDGLQVLKFRTGQWCRPAMDGAAQVCYDASATAITTVSYINKAGDAKDGQIVDADIELNAVNNVFFNADKGPAPADPRNPADLWNTLTHEIGHMQGLDHTCRSAAESATGCTVDNAGAQRPLCSDVTRQRLTNSAYLSIYNTTMFAVADPAETRKRVPQSDDVKGITDSYPLSRDPKSCVLPGSMPTGGCTAAATGSPVPPWSGWALALSAMAAALGLRRRFRLG